MQVQSCLYEVDISHARTSPRKHSFKQRHFMFFIDLDEATEYGERLFGRMRAIYEFRQTDYIPDPVHIYSLKERVHRLLMRNGLPEPQQVKLLTNVRTFGYIFNPITLIYCFDGDGRAFACIAEVGNTFGESKPYILKPDENGVLGGFNPKLFYVSPFSSLSDSFSFNCPAPSDDLKIKIETIANGGKSVSAYMAGKRISLSESNLLAQTIKHPFATLRVMTLIHFHALLLWMKRIPYILKEDNPQLQQGVLRSHASVLSSRRYR